MSLAVSIRSESLKIKRTLAVYICILACAFGPLMTFLENTHPGPNTPINQPWLEHFMDGRQALNIAMLPFYIILTATLLLQIEYKDKTWKQVLSSPQTFLNVFLSKFIILQLMGLLFMICYNGFLALAAWGTEMSHPELYNGTMDYTRWFTVNAQTFILIQGVCAIQFWLALRFKNFIGPVAIGVALWFAAPMMLFEFKTPIVQYHPYAFTILGVMPDYKAKIVTYQWYSLFTMTFFLLLAFTEFRLRKVRS